MRPGQRVLVPFLTVPSASREVLAAVQPSFDRVVSIGTPTLDECPAW